MDELSRHLAAGLPLRCNGHGDLADDLELGTVLVSCERLRNGAAVLLGLGHGVRGSPQVPDLILSECLNLCVDSVYIGVPLDQVGRRLALLLRSGALLAADLRRLARLDDLSENLLEGLNLLSRQRQGDGGRHGRMLGGL